MLGFITLNSKLLPSKLLQFEGIAENPPFPAVKENTGSLASSHTDRSAINAQGLLL